MYIEPIMGLIIEVTAKWAATLILSSIGAAMLLNQLVVNYGPTTLRLLAMCKRAAVVVSQAVLLIAWLYNVVRIALSAASDFRYSDNPFAIRIFKAGDHLNAAVGALVITNTAIYVIEMVAGKRWPRSVEEVVALRPLTFGTLRHSACSAQRNGSENLPPGSDRVTSASNVTNGTDQNIKIDGETTSDAAETTKDADSAQDDYDELTRSDIDGWKVRQ